MNVSQMSLEQIRQQGLKALARELGPAGLVRFLQQFESGRGDYTSDRHQWLTDDVRTIARRVKRRPKRRLTRRGK